MITYYLAGPMSWIPQFNYPLFREAAKHLRRLGYNIISPAEMDSGEMQQQALESEDGDPTTLAETWGYILSRDVEVVADSCQGIILLPNWEQSKGARLEAFTALQCDHEFKLFNLEDGLTDLPHSYYVQGKVLCLTSLKPTNKK